MTARRRPDFGGLVLYLYLLAWMGQLVLLYGGVEDVGRVASWWATLAGRTLAAVVLLAAVHHLLEGLGRAAGAGDRPARWATVAVPFLTGALVVPGWAVLYRPWLAP